MYESWLAMATPLAIFHPTVSMDYKEEGSTVIVGVVSMIHT